MSDRHCSWWPLEPYDIVPETGPRQDGSNVVKHTTRGGKGVVAQANERGKRKLPRKKNKR